MATKNATERLRYQGQYDDDLYWKRVRRNLGWLGDTEDEQRLRQEKLRDVVVGIAGCGGIGGAVADRLVRLGVRNLKIADPDTFDVSNINRQLGATVDNVGKNKAEVVAEMVYNLTRDVNIEVYPEGIVPETVDEFVFGCDYVMDKINLYAIDARYALHRAFRNSDRCKFMLTIPVFEHRAYVFKWTKESMSAEEYFGVPEGAEMTADMARQLLNRFIPEIPDYPSRETLNRWFIDDLTCPIFAGSPPLAQGLLVERLGLEITGLDQLPGAFKLPVTPGYAMFDALKWETKVVYDKWWA